MRSPYFLWCILLSTCLAATPEASAQTASAPDEAIIPPGVPPDERVDITGDGIADLVITGHVDRTSDPEQGLFGWYRRGVRTLPGSSLLLRTTPNMGGYDVLGDSERIDTASLAKRFHFKQLMWSPATEVSEFRLLQQAFGPGVVPGAMGWYGTGEYYNGTMVLRSTVGGRTQIAAFTVWFELPSGRIGVTAKEVITVPADFGKEGDPPSPVPKVPEPYDLGLESNGPQVIIPPGIPPDVQMNVAGDDAPDVVLTGHEEHWHPGSSPGQARIGGMGYYVRGVSPLPGMSFLMRRGTTDQPWTIFRLPYGQQLRPDSLAMGLHNGTLHWASPERESVFCPVLHHPFGMDGLPQEWSLVDEHWEGDLVYRTTYYGRETIIGVLELRPTVPGGELWVQPQNWVEEGKVLQVR